jgi:hypothetical protein
MKEDRLHPVHPGEVLPQDWLFRPPAAELGALATVNTASW